MERQHKPAAWWGMLRPWALQADYEALLRLDDDVSTRQPVSEAQIAALPTHVHRVQVHRLQCSSAEWAQARRCTLNVQVSVFARWLLCPVCVWQHAVG